MHNALLTPTQNLLDDPGPRLEKLDPSDGQKIELTGNARLLAAMNR